jgi:hypothetical protein
MRKHPVPQTSKWVRWLVLLSFAVGIGLATAGIVLARYHDLIRVQRVDMQMRRRLAGMPLPEVHLVEFPIQSRHWRIIIDSNKVSVDNAELLSALESSQIRGLVRTLGDAHPHSFPFVSEQWPPDWAKLVSQQEQRTRAIPILETIIREAHAFYDPHLFYALRIPAPNNEVRLVWADRQIPYVRFQRICRGLGLVGVPCTHLAVRDARDRVGYFPLVPLDNFSLSCAPLRIHLRREHLSIQTPRGYLRAGCDTFGPAMETTLRIQLRTPGRELTNCLRQLDSVGTGQPDAEDLATQRCRYMHQIPGRVSEYSVAIMVDDTVDVQTVVSVIDEVRAWWSGSGPSLWVLSAENLQTVRCQPPRHPVAPCEQP